MHLRLAVITVAIAISMLFTPRTGRAASGPAGWSGGEPGRLSYQPAVFTANRGQWDERVRFRATTRGTIIWFCDDGITFQVLHREQVEGALRPLTAAIAPHALEYITVHAAFADGSPDAVISGETELPYHYNYYLGSNPAGWQTRVPNYAAIVYHDAYPGGDIRCEFDGMNLRATLESRTRANAPPVQFNYQSDAPLTRTAADNVLVETPWGQCALPFGPGNDVAMSRTAAGAASSAGGQLSLQYSTYVGGGDDDEAYSIDVDSAGNAYVTGRTISSDFPTQSAYDGTLSGATFDAFVTRLSAAGNALVYSTFLGGGDYEIASDIHAGSNGAVYIMGLTRSSNFPTLNAYDAVLGGSDDTFVTKLASDGGSLEYSTYLGGSSHDFAGDADGGGIAVDNNGRAYVVSSTWSLDFPTVNAYDATYNGGQQDAYVARLSALGNALEYSTYLGGMDLDAAYDVAVDDAGNAYVIGKTRSSDFPTVNAYDDTFNGNQDAFIAKLSAAGNTLEYSTFLGGGNYDWGNGIVVTGEQVAYVCGYTWSTDFPTVDPFDGTGDVSSDGYVARLSTGGSALEFSTYLGGSAGDLCYSIVLDADDEPIVTGITVSTDFPLLNPYMGSLSGAVDVFVTKLSTITSSLEYSTYVGGSDEDRGYHLSRDNNGAIYITGFTMSGDFPTLNAFDATHNGGNDVFVVKFNTVCDCPFQLDLDEDGFVTALDLAVVIDILFAGEPDIQDANCPVPRADFDCDGFSTALDLSALIDYLFGGGDPPCEPCAL